MKSKMPSAAIESIDAIARLEQEFLQQRTFWNRVADAVADFTGSIVFVVVHLVVFAVWFSINTGVLKIARPFDPYPFVLLGMGVSCEAVLLSTFVLMKQ